MVLWFHVKIIYIETFIFINGNFCEKSFFSFRSLTFDWNYIVRYALLLTIDHKQSFVWVEPGTTMEPLWNHFGTTMDPHSHQRFYLINGVYNMRSIHTLKNLKNVDPRGAKWFQKSSQFIQWVFIKWIQKNGNEENFLDFIKQIVPEWIKLGWSSNGLHLHEVTIECFILTGRIVMKLQINSQSHREALKCSKNGKIHEIAVTSLNNHFIKTSHEKKKSWNLKKS